MVVLRYEGGRKGAAPIALVGKGVTFDTGGISIKPSTDMDKMKYDKSGAIAVLCSLVAASRLKLKINLIAVMALTENTPSGSASKPGDLVTAMSGKTIEILNTDAEGRVILADALHYAESFNPQAVISIATLTGACTVALSNKAAGLMGNNSKIIRQLKEAGDYAYERVWELPMWSEYDEHVKSEIADVRNTGTIPGHAGTIVAAKFLEKFVSKPWAHLDVAAMMDSDKDKPEFARGGTGYGVRLLAMFAENWGGV